MKNKALQILTEEYNELQRKIQIGNYLGEKSMIIRRDKLVEAIKELEEILESIENVNKWKYMFNTEEILKQLNLIIKGYKNEKNWSLY